MEQATQTRFIYFQLPDPDHLAAVGGVSICHGHLDHMLRMTIKSLSDLPLGEALLATERDSSAELRDTIKRLGKTQLGKGTVPFLKLCAILEKCRQVTERRNEIVHAIVGTELDGVHVVKTRSNDWEDLPSLEKINALAVEIQRVAYELNEARRHGFLQEALAVRSSKLGKHEANEAAKS
jgi:hypothetical protein